MSGNEVDTDPEGFLTNWYLVKPEKEKKKYENLIIPYLNSKNKYQYQPKQK